jgi:hypothetical protein
MMPMKGTRPLTVFADRCATTARVPSHHAFLGEPHALDGVEAQRDVNGHQELTHLGHEELTHPGVPGRVALTQ